MTSKGTRTLLRSSFRGLSIYVINLPLHQTALVRIDHWQLKSGNAVSTIARMFLSTAFCAFAIWLPNFAKVTALWPQPATVSLGENVLKLSPTVAFTKLDELGTKPDVVLDAAILRCRTLLKDGFVPWALSIPGEKYEPELNTAPVISEVSIQKINPSYQVVDRDVLESYQLEISMNGKIWISSGSTLGIMHGLSTLTQLFYTHSDGVTVYTKSAPVRIDDAPTMRWRGLNIDISRNFLKITDLEKIIDSMSWNKMNRLHLHATDSQSWPLEVSSMPDLAIKGSFGPSAIMSTTDFEHIQSFAKQRGVEVVTEIDMPGHTASIAKSYPELIVGYNIQSKNWVDSTEGSSALSTTDWSAYCAVRCIPTLRS